MASKENNTNAFIVVLTVFKKKILNLSIDNKLANTFSAQIWSISVIPIFKVILNLSMEGATNLLVLGYLKMNKKEEEKLMGHYTD